MFADSVRVVSIHCVARGLGASFLYKCPASSGSSLRQHGFLVIKTHRHEASVNGDVISNARCSRTANTLKTSLNETLMFVQSIFSNVYIEVMNLVGLQAVFVLIRGK